MYLVYAQIRFSKVTLLVLPLHCSPPERNLRAESRLVQLVFGKETVTGCWSAGVGPLAGLPLAVLSAGQSRSGLLKACSRQWCSSLPWAQRNGTFYNPPGQWTGKSGDSGSGPVHQPETGPQLLCPGRPLCGVGSEGDTKKCGFLVLVLQIWPLLLCSGHCWLLLVIHWQ